MTIVDDDLYVEDKRKPLAQEGDSAFERNLALLVKKKFEIKFVMVTNASYSGFVTALDELYLEICETHSKNNIILNRDHIVSIAASGKSLSEITRAEAEKGKILEEKSYHFHKVCSGFLNSHGLS